MEEKRERILMAAMRGVRERGLDGVRIQYIGRLAGMAPSNIYGYFPSKDEVMRACFEHVDRQLAETIAGALPDEAAILRDPQGEIRRVWRAYYRWLVAHPDETCFYHRYRDSAGFPDFDKGRDVSYFGAFIGFVRGYDARFGIFSRVAPDVLWLHLLTTTVLFAKNVVEGVLPDSAGTEESVFLLLMRGVDALLEGGPPG